MLKQLNWAHWISGQAGVIPLSLGIPGVAKTAMHLALARALGRPFFCLMLDQCLPEDLGGFPVVRQYDHNGKMIDVMARVHDERFILAELLGGVFLYDELTNCPHATQAASLQRFTNVLENCLVFSAGNPIDKAAAGVDLTPPMVNRLCVLQWETDREAVLDGWRHGFNFPAPSIPILPDYWRDFCPKWGNLLAMFIERKPDLLEAFPNDLAQASAPWPSPRSWTNVGKLRAAAESVEANKETQFKLTAGCVGQGAALEFDKWLDEQNLPDPEWLLSHPDRLALPRRGDMAIAILSSVFGRVRANNTPQRWEALGDLIEVGYGQNQEVITAGLGDYWKIKPQGHLPKLRNGRWAEMNKTLLGNK